MRKLKQLLSSLAGISLAASLLALAGCQGLSIKQPGLADAELSANTLGRLRPADQITISFSGVPNPPAKFEGRINEDGGISLPLIGPVRAAGKTTAELEQYVHYLYVTNYFVRLTVNVNSENRFFFVDREVRSPSRQVYAGEMTVLKAIASAGGFTDFANKKKVKLIRANGEILTVNCMKAQDHSELDLPVYPGDKIIVPRRWY